VDRWEGGVSDNEVVIEYAAAENGRGRGYGWLPAVWVNGKRCGDRWARDGLSKEDALTAALHDAKGEAARYVGDWSIVMRPRGEKP